MSTNSSWPESGLSYSKEQLQLVAPLEWVDFESQAIYKINNHIVKTGGNTEMAEALTMKIVGEKTSVPVPRVLNAYRHESGYGGTHGTIIMEQVEGEELGNIWDDMTSEEKSAIIEQLRGYMEELHAIEGSFIGSVSNTMCENLMLNLYLGAFDRYDNEASFHEDIIKALRKYEDEESAKWRSGQRELLKGPKVDLVADFFRALPPHKIVLTHGNFKPRNILVREGKVVAITGWDSAGYYPEYWDYMKAYYKAFRGCRWDRDRASDFDWHKDRAIDKILKPFPLELAVLMHAQNVLQ